MSIKTLDSVRGVRVVQNEGEPLNVLVDELERFGLIAWDDERDVYFTTGGPSEVFSPGEYVIVADNHSGALVPNGY